MSSRFAAVPKNLRPGTFLTATQKLMKGIWPWARGPRARLPKHYKVRYIESYMKEPKPVNYIPVPDRFSDQRSPHNIPIPVKYPKVADEGLWGGEGVVEGLYRHKNDPKKARDVWIWKPTVSKHLFYSEILDRWMEITVTRRTLDQVDDCKGFDNYILQTHEVDLKSKLGMTLKREMQYALHSKSFHPDNPQKQKEIYNKYKHFMIPYKEIEWLGLDIYEAEYKLLEKEESERLQATPYKFEYMKDLVQQLKDGTFDEEDELPGAHKAQSMTERIKEAMPFTGKKGQK